MLRLVRNQLQAGARGLLPDPQHPWRCGDTSTSQEVWEMGADPQMSWRADGDPVSPGDLSASRHRAGCAEVSGGEHAEQLFCQKMGLHRNQTVLGSPSISMTSSKGLSG